MSRTPPTRRQVELLAEASDLPLRPEWLDDLAARWDFFREGIERLAALASELPVTLVEPEDEE